jgi:hypothetical protein
MQYSRLFALKKLLVFFLYKTLIALLPHMFSTGQIGPGMYGLLTDGADSIVFL